MTQQPHRSAGEVAERLVDSATTFDKGQFERHEEKRHWEMSSVAGLELDWNGMED